MVTSDLPPSTKQGMWSPISSTLSYGERDAVLIDAGVNARCVLLCSRVHSSQRTRFAAPSPSLISRPGVTRPPLRLVAGWAGRTKRASAFACCLAAIASRSWSRRVCNSDQEVSRSSFMACPSASRGEGFCEASEEAMPRDCREFVPEDGSGGGSPHRRLAARTTTVASVHDWLVTLA
jgi:hypothetical protein